MKRLLFQLLSSLIFLVGVLCIGRGIWVFENKSYAYSLGYPWLIAGAFSIALLPSSASLAIRALLSWPMSWLPLSLAFGWCAWNLFPIAAALESTPTHHREFFSLWAGSLLGMIALAFGVDRYRGVIIQFPSRKDTYTFMALLLIAFIVRMAGPTTLVSDEAANLLFVSQLQRGSFNPLHLSVTAYPYLMHYLVFNLHLLTKHVLDLLDVYRGFSFFCGALSVATWFAVVRMFASWRIATCSGIILCFFGWHWLNSRFIYQYPLDLAIIPVAIFLFTVAMRTRSVLVAVLAGMACATALIIQKVGFICLGFLLYLGLEFLWADRKKRPLRLVGVGLVVLIAIAISFEPFIAKMATDGLEVWFPRQQESVDVRAHTLARLGLSSWTAFIFTLKDMFYQFFVMVCDDERHRFRSGAPILDPICAALFAVGMAVCFISSYKSMPARICLIGLLVFFLPMGLAFPVGGEFHGVARRMIGTSFFVSWIAAIGAEHLSRRLVQHGRETCLVILLAISSAIANIHFYFSSYLRPEAVNWYNHRGIQYAATVELTREAARRNIPTVVLKSWLAGVDNSVDDFENVLVASTTAEVRSALLSRPGVLQMVIIPWDTAFFERPSTIWVQELSDIIPAYLWIPGAKDQDEVPMVRYAYVRSPKQ